MKHFYCQIDNQIFVRDFTDPSVKHEILQGVSLTKDQAALVTEALSRAYTQGVVDGESKVKYHIKEALGLL